MLIAVSVGSRKVQRLLSGTFFIFMLTKIVTAMGWIGNLLLYNYEETI